MELPLVLRPGFRVWVVDYRQAAEFCAQHHRHLPKAPPPIQISLCLAAGGSKIHAIAMLGQPVAPAHSRTCLEVRRMISDGRLYRACSVLYALLAYYSHQRDRDLLTYTFNADAVSVIAAGGIYEGERKSGKDTRKNRVNLTSEVNKHRWRWPKQKGSPDGA